MTDAQSRATPSSFVSSRIGDVAWNMFKRAASANRASHPEMRSHHDARAEPPIATWEESPPCVAFQCHSCREEAVTSLGYGHHLRGELGVPPRQG